MTIWIRPKKVIEPWENDIKFGATDIGYFLSIIELLFLENYLIDSI